MKNELKKVDGTFIDDLRHIVTKSRQHAYFAVNTAQVAMNWLIGRRIVEQEQCGKDRAEYGKYVIKLASEALTKEFGKGFDVTNIFNFRRIYLTFKDLPILQTVSEESTYTIGQTVIHL